MAKNKLPGDEDTPAEALHNDRPMSALDRVIAQAVGAERTLGLAADPARDKYPTLWDWLSRIYVGRDYVKQPATLTVRLGPEGALATLTDRDLGVSLDVSAPSLLGLLQAMEEALAGPNPPIRSWGRKEPHVRKRKS